MKFPLIIELRDKPVATKSYRTFFTRRPVTERLYVIDSSQYDGLRYRSSFDIKKIIYYPDGGTAFYLVSGL